MNDKRGRIARLLRIISNDYLEEVFGSQVTMSVLWPLMYHQLGLARPKKPGGKDLRAPNNSGLKHSIRFPRNAKGAAQFDQDNGNLL